MGWVSSETGSKASRRPAQCWGHEEGAKISSRRDTLTFSLLWTAYQTILSVWHGQKSRNQWLLAPQWYQSIHQQDWWQSFILHSPTQPPLPTHRRWHMSFSELICMVGQRSLQSCTECFCRGHSLEQKNKQPYAGLPCALPRLNLGILDLGRLSIPFKGTQTSAALDIGGAIPCLAFSRQGPYAVISASPRNLCTCS